MNRPRKFRSRFLQSPLYCWSFILLLVTSCSTGRQQVPIKKQGIRPGNQTWISGSHSITVDGRKRTFLLDVPRNLKSNASLVLVFHGYTGSAAGIRSTAGFTPLTKEHGFVAVYPQGTQDSKGKTFFNVGYAFHEESKVDDIHFITELTAKLVKDLELNAEAVFSTGMSNGGDMSYLLARQPEPIVRAIAPVAGTMMVSGNETFIPKKRLSVMEVHGTDDKITRWNGDLENHDGWGSYFGTEKVMSFWIDGFSLEKSGTTQLLNIPSDQRQIQLHRWWTTTDDTEVLLYERQEGGHTWPDHLGQPSVSTADEIWSFFNRHR